MRGVAKFGTNQRSPQHTDAVTRVSSKLPNTKRSIRGDPVRHRPAAASGSPLAPGSAGGSAVRPAPDRAARRQMDRRRRARQEPPWRRRAALVACGVAAGVVMASCGGSGASDGSHPTTTRAKSTTTTSIPVTSTTLVPTSAAVLSAYRAGWAAFEHALTTANPSDPELAATMVDPSCRASRPTSSPTRERGWWPEALSRCIRRSRPCRPRRQLWSTAPTAPPSSSTRPLASRCRR